MRLNDARVLLTGAAGGIGRALAAELLKQGAQVLMVDRDEASLRVASQQLAFGELGHEVRVVDLTQPPERSRLCQLAGAWRGGVNVLINNAGVNPFGLFDDLTSAQIERTLAVNVLAPMQLTHEFLPHLRAQPCASILNIGSVFGAIGYPGYVAYSASKFAIRGFTEALRRELGSGGPKVLYLAPRATRTPINSSTVEQMNKQLGVAMDPPQTVARAAIRLLASDRPSAVVGWPEKLFVRLNAWVPALVDRAIRRQLPIIEHHARRNRGELTQQAAPAPASIPVSRRHIP